MMDEIVDFLGVYDIESSVQVVYENERLEVDSFFTRPIFGSLLQSGDPPHWQSHEEGTGVTSLEKYAVPKDYVVVYPFTFSRAFPLEIQKQFSGWKYSSSFSCGEWVSVPTRNCHVRQRKWERLIVKADSYDRCLELLPIYYEDLGKVRTLRPDNIKSCLSSKNISAVFQYVLESQRKNDDFFSSKHLYPDSDPPAWSVINSTDQRMGYITDDFIQGRLAPYNESCAIDRRQGFDLLLNFRPILFPEKDDFGWQYSYSFTCNSSEWSSHADLISSHKSNSIVRKRVWFRVLVPDSSMTKSRRVLHEYLANHPRPVVTEGDFFLLNSFQSNWRHRLVSLFGSQLIIKDPSKNIAMKKIDYDLDITQHSVSLLSARDCPGKNAGIGIRPKCLETINSFSAILCSLDEEKCQEWVLKIELQMCQLDFDRALSDGPPSFDKIVLANDMWIQKKTFPYGWNLRTFELHESGFVNILNGVHVTQRIDFVKAKYILGKKVRFNVASSPRYCGDGSDFEFAVVPRHDEAINIRAMSQCVLTKWIGKMLEFGGRGCEDENDIGKSSFSSNQIVPENEGLLQKSDRV